MSFQTNHPSQLCARDFRCLLKLGPNVVPNPWLLMFQRCQSETTDTDVTLVACAWLTTALSPSPERQSDGLMVRVDNEVDETSRKGRGVSETTGSTIRPLFVTKNNAMQSAKVSVYL